MDHSTSEPLHPTLAIVGIGVRFPGGANAPESFAHFLETNGDGIVDVPPERWNVGRFYSPDKSSPGRSYVKRAGFLTNNVFEMDPAPFHLSPRECTQLDPQQRILLETCWEALEDAAIPIDRLGGSKTGVYIGGFMLDSRDIWTHPENRPYLGGQSATALGNTVLSNRLSYTFDFRGPSLTVDTACSSSLVTIHLACRDLLDGICDLAVAGGVNVMLSPMSTLLMCKGQFLAADGRSKAFDAAADGYGRGEGAGLIILKRLEDARRDGDRIYATILATGVNQDGRTEGMPFPNGEAQEELSRRVSGLAGIDPLKLGYVEAHGTGTKAGDVTEVAALSRVYSGPGRTRPLAIGSIKTNIGHTEAAAGVAGVIKAALSLYQRRIFPVRALDTPNPAIDFEGLGVRVPVESEAWPEDAELTVAVNSFGYGGTNAHAVLAAVPKMPCAESQEKKRETRCFLPISAFDETALKARAKELAPLALSTLHELASTLAHHRGHLSQRAVVIADNKQSAHDTLMKLADGVSSSAIIRERADANKLCCVYTGMGPQWWAMGGDLFDTEEVFYQAAVEIDELFSKVSGWSLLEEMRRPESESKMERNWVAQPANFLLQASLTQLLRSRGVHFDAYLGHSVGELSAAWAAGCLSLEEAVFAAFHRSDLQQQVAGRGTMLAVGVGVEQGYELCRKYDDVAVAAINGSRSIALSGKEDQLRRIAQELEAKGDFAKMMRVEVAYHSPHMEPLREGFHSRLAHLSPTGPTSELFSTTLGAQVVKVVHDAAYWWENARQPVLLESALDAALAAGCDVFLEVGPHPVLGASILAAGRKAARSVKSVSSLTRKESQTHAFDRCLGTLHCVGVKVDWEQMAPRTQRIALPHYPFQRKAYWEESPAALEYRVGRKGAHPFLDQRSPTATKGWSTELEGEGFQWLDGHRIQGARVFPAAGYLELGLAASRECFGEHSEIILEDLRFENALVLPADELAKVIAELHGDELRIYSDAGAGLQSNARMRLLERAPYSPLASLDLQTLTDGLKEIDVDESYARLGRAGLHYTGHFRALRRVFLGDAKIVAEIEAPSVDGFLLFPATLDAAFQALLAGGNLEQAMVPTKIERLRFSRPATTKTYAVCSRNWKGEPFTFDVGLFDEHGRAVASVEALHCDFVEKSGELRSTEQAWFHRRDWQSSPPQDITLESSLVIAGGDASLVEELTAKLSETGQKLNLGSGEDVLLPHLLFVVSGEEDELGEAPGLMLIQLTSRLSAGARVTVLTKGAYSVHGEATNPASTAVCGVARVLLTERPELLTQIVDLPISEDVHPALLRDTIRSQGEEESALRGGSRYSMRIVRAALQGEERQKKCRPFEKGESCELFTRKTGAIDSLAYRPRNYPDALGADEVEIQVECASLNFKDLMKVMGLLGETALHRTYLGKKLGIEAAGRALRVGKNITHIRPGQLVVGFFGGALSTKVRASGHLTVVASEKHSPEVASTLLVFATAWHGLLHRANLRRGEKVLIHAASGGVGLAAIQVAQHLGAEIYATASQKAKRDYLRSLGVEHVYDSRTLDYADAISRETRGKGIDVVLNSLAGEHLRRSLELLAPGGRFVELGKQDFAENTKLGLLPFNRALTLHAVDLDRMSMELPDSFRPLAEEVCRAFDDGILSKLPSEVFAATEVISAFRRLGDTQRIGKLIIDFRQGLDGIYPGWTEKPVVSSVRSYLVTGGLAGFGLRTAQWLAEMGAGEVVLASRKGAANDEGEARLAEIVRNNLCKISCVKLDVTDRKATSDLIVKLSRGERPLAGVFHAAAVLDDRPLSEIDADSLKRVLAPKAGGAWNLHLATKELKLDHFVLFSSISALVGNPGQASYAAANSFLDGLAALRRSMGLPGTSVSWGAIADLGMLARDSATEAHLQSMGFSALKPARALEALRVALAEPWCDFGIVAADWTRWKRHTSRTPWQRLSLLEQEDTSQKSDHPLMVELLATDVDERLSVIQRVMREAVAPAFKLVPADLDIEQPLRDLGLDSLLAVEVQAQVEAKTGVELSSMEVLSGRPTSALAALVLNRLLSSAAMAESEVPRVRNASGIPGDLREFFLERICVQPPYFAFESVEEDSGWVTGEVVPAQVPKSEPHVLDVAEAGRHVAILGSCAARLAYEETNGRVYYPVRASRLLEWSNRRLPKRVVARARCLSYDQKTSSAVCETEMHSRSGELICRFEVIYHVISERDFVELFASRRISTDESSGNDPYTTYKTVSSERVETGCFVGVEQWVNPAECLGHFVNFPAYPVSIMLRDAISTTHQALSVEHGGELQWELGGGTCSTSKFIFAGERARIETRRTKFAGRKEAWICEIKSGTEVCASFEFEVQVNQSVIPHIETRKNAARLGAVK